MDLQNVNRVSLKADILLNCIFILFAIACLFPVLLVISVSLSDAKSIIQNGFTLIPLHFSFAAYQYLFSDPTVVLRAYSVTILVVVVGTVFGVLFMSLYAYPLSRTDFPYRGIFTFYIFFTMLFGGGIVSFYLIYTSVLHLRDSLWALILPGLISPFNLIVIRSFFQSSIHPALVEAAKIDGASEMRLFFQIIIPLSLPVLATMGLFTGLAYWNDWFNSLLFINNKHLNSLQFLMLNAMLTLQYIQQQIGSGNSNLAKEIMKSVPEEGIRMAMVVIGMGPIVAVYPFVQKFFVSGITVGSVKG